MNEPRILVLVLAIDKDPWKKIEIEGQISTWRNLCPDNVKILRYIGAKPQGSAWYLMNKLWLFNQKVNGISRGRISLFSINLVLKKRKFQKSKVDIEKNEISTFVPDLYSLIGAKTLEAFKISLEKFDFDFIFRTNASSYLDLRGLKGYLEDKPKNNFYAGVIGNHQSINFASGCGYFISRDLVDKVLINRDLWDHNHIDDVSLGKLLTEELQADIQEVKRIDIDSSDFDLSLVKSNPLKVFHYRCKAADPNTTIRIMKALHTLA